MKILYIITQADGGGAQKYVLQLAKHFRGAIAAGNEAAKLFDEGKKAGLETFKLAHLKRDINLWHDLSAIWEIRQLIKNYRPDIVHLNSTKAGILGSIAGSLARRGKNREVNYPNGRLDNSLPKIIFTAHGFVFNEPMAKPVKMFYLALEKIASGYRDFIIAVSQADKQSALNNNLITSDKISVIHNGLAPTAFLAKDEARAQLRLPQHVFVFGTVAGFYKTKGLDILIEAVAKLDSKIRDRCLFMLIGDGPERKNLELRIKNYGLGNTIKLSGKIPNASMLLKAFDAFILPSRKEGFPYSILEAMQAGLPIIAANVGGVPEALGDAGMVIKPENPQLLAQAIAGLQTNPETQKLLADKALARSKIFTEEKMLEATKKVYSKLLT